MKSDIFCGLDIGGSSVRALVARCSRPGENEKILGYAESSTRGFSNGVVSNLTSLSDTIEEAVSGAEHSARCEVRKVIVGISGPQIRTLNSHGSVRISERPSEITEADIKRCIESARLLAMSLDREVLHLIPNRFYIDDKIEIEEPLGLFGSKLDVELNIVTSLSSVLQNLIKAVNVAGYEVEDVAVSSAGTSLAILDPRELEEGAIIVDVGKDLTEAAIFTGGRLRECFYFPFGSDDLTRALQDRLKIMFEQAEELRIKYGIITGPALESESGQDMMGGNWVDSEVLYAGACSGHEDNGLNVITRREISSILFPKMEEIMQDVYKKIEPFLKKSKKMPHITLTGRISRMDGFIEAVEKIFGVPVNMGTIRNIADFHDTTFACALGLVRYGAKSRQKKKLVFFRNTNTILGKVISRIQSVLSEYF